MAPSSGFLDFAISMRPDYHQAIIDAIRFYGWDKIIYLYDSHDGKCLLLLVNIYISLLSIILYALCPMCPMDIEMGAFT